MVNKRISLHFPPSLTTKTFTYTLIKEYDWNINIIKASISEGKEGKLLVEVNATEENLVLGLKFLEEQGISVAPLDKQVNIDKEKCVACGACTAVCLSDALVMDRETWDLVFDSEKCVVCGLCAEACPLQIIKIGF